MAQDARSRVGMTWKGRRCPIARQRAAGGSWGSSASGSRTSPKPPFQNPSIAGSACVSVVWDSGVALEAGEMRTGGPTASPQASAGHRRTAPQLLGSPPPRFRGKSRDTGMLVWAPARRRARPLDAPARRRARPPAPTARPRPTVRRPHSPVSFPSAPLRRPDLPVLERQFDEQRFQFVLVARDRQLRLDPPQLRDPRLDLGLLLVQRPERG